MSSDPLTRFYLDGEARIRPARRWRFGRLAYAIFEAGWLGAFDAPRLNAVTQAFYSRNEHRYFDPVYNASGFMDWERAAFEKFFGGCASVLVTGAGGGREVLALAGLGIKLAAFECSPELVAAGNAFLAAHGVAAPISHAPPNLVPTSEIYDGAIVGWGSYMHIPGRDARIEFLRALRARTRCRGPLLLSFRTRSRDGRMRIAVARVANVVRRLLRRGPVEVGDELKGWYRHVFTRDEIASELVAGGFALVHFARDGYGHAVGIAA